MDRRKNWQRIEKALEAYQLRGSPMRWFDNWRKVTKGRAEIWVFSRLLVLIGALCLATYTLPRECPRDWLQAVGAAVAFGIAGFLVFDIMAANTASAFFGAEGRQLLRSAFLLVVAYIELQVGFAVFYLVVWCGFSGDLLPAMVNPLTAVYASFAMLTSPNIIIPKGPFATVCVIAQLAFGFYFVGMLVSTVFSITRSPTPASDKQMK